MATAIMNTTTGIVYVRSIGGTLSVSNLSVSGHVLGSGDLRAGAANYIYWSTRTTMSSPADGVLLLQDAALSTFGRIQLGGTTSSFPAVSRNSAALTIRLADDSNYTELWAGPITSAKATATPAGGSASGATYIGSASVGIYIGTGAPTVSAAKGSLYMRTDATTTTTRLYINTDGATTWTNFTSAA